MSKPFISYTARNEQNVQQEVFHAAGCAHVQRARDLSKRNPLAVDPTSFAYTRTSSVAEAIEDAYGCVIDESVLEDGGNPDNETEYREVARGYAEYIKAMPCAIVAGFIPKF